MTTNVQRGAGRASAKARTAKAAQRTEHPPRRMGSLTQEAAKASNTAGPKAEALAEALKPFGWKTTVKTSPTGEVTLTAKRGKETLVVAWSATGCFMYDESLYTSPERKFHPRNVSAARQFCERAAG